MEKKLYKWMNTSTLQQVLSGGFYVFKSLPKAPVVGGSRYLHDLIICPWGNPKNGKKPPQHASLVDRRSWFSSSARVRRRPPCSMFESPVFEALVYKNMFCFYMFLVKVKRMPDVVTSLLPLCSFCIVSSTWSHMKILRPNLSTAGKWDWPDFDSRS